MFELKGRPLTTAILKNATVLRFLPSFAGLLLILLSPLMGLAQGVSAGIAGEISACPAGHGCMVTVDPAYPGGDMRGLLLNQTIRTPLPYATRLRDERYGAVNDAHGETVGTARHFGSQHTLTLFRPILISISRARGVTTIAGLQDDRWCTVPLLVVNASDPSFNSQMSADGEHLTPFDAATCPLRAVTFAQAGPDVAAATALLTAYPKPDSTQIFTQVAAGGGNLNGGVETIAHTNDDNSLFLRIGLNHQRGAQCLFGTKGDGECSYRYMTYHQEDGGTADDENLYFEAAHTTEITSVPQLKVVSVASSNHLYVTQTGGVIPPGAGHKLLVTVGAGGGTAAAYRGNVQSVDPPPPATLFNQTKLLAIDATVPVSTSWGTFTPILTPPNSDYGVMMRTTLTQTGGGGSPHTGWFCLVTGERYERSYLTLDGVGPFAAAGKIRNLLRTTSLWPVLQWAQGGVCDSPIGGGEAMILKAAQYGAAAGSVAQVPQLWISPDAHTVGYVFASNGTLVSFSQVYPNIIKETLTLNFSRLAGKVLVTGFPNALSQGNGQNGIIRWCGHAVAVTAADPSLNGTFTLNCDNADAPGRATYQQAKSMADTAATVSGMATYDSGLEAFAVYPMEIITNTVDETNACAGLNCYVETESTNLAWAPGMQMEDHVGLTSFTAAPLYLHCQSANCRNQYLAYDGRGIRGGPEGGLGFSHSRVGNTNALTQYQRFGGIDTPPTYAALGGYWGTIFDFTDIYASHNNTGAIFPGTTLFNASRCPERLNFAEVGPCQGSDDAWTFLDTVLSNRGGGVTRATAKVDVNRGALLALYFNETQPKYSWGVDRWDMGDSNHNPHGTPGGLWGPVTLNGSGLCTAGSYSANNGACNPANTPVTAVQMIDSETHAVRTLTIKNGVLTVQ